MKNYSTFIAVLVLGFFCAASVNTIYGQATGTEHAIIPKEISKEDAAKKYPPPDGKEYPRGIALPTSTGGFFRSPYSAKVYDGRKLKFKGALILDDGVNKVFRAP
jgi:hypothetical protein